MDYALVAIGGVVLVVLAAAFSKKLGVAAPLLLVLVGIGYSFIPGLPDIEVEPEVILRGVLPPLLYAAAIQVPIVDFRRNFLSISALSVVLVVVSALITGFVIYMVLPDIDLAAAIALGAVISPTDVVAATSIGRRLGLPPRLMTVLEGEGLVNDATALVLLRTAIAASALAAEGVFDAGGAVLSFFYAVVVAGLFGLIVGIVSVFVRRRLNEPILDTVISFAVPFIAYLPAEEMGASGVIAVVVAGIYAGHQSARLSPQSRNSERLNWRTLQFVLENGVFLLMGAQVAGIVADVKVDKLSVHGAVLLGLLVAGILIVLRFAFVWPLLAVVRRGERGAVERSSRLGEFAERVRSRVSGSEREQRQNARFELAIDRRQNDIEQLQNEGLGWRGGIVLGWAGMRGVVTLAAAQSLPTTTPYYEQLVLIAFTVAVFTLLLQGGSLPLVIRWTGIRGSDRAADRRELATLLDELGDAGVAALDGPDLELPGGQRIEPEVIERVRRDTQLASEAAWERADNAGDDSELMRSPHQQYRDLRSQVLDAERAALLEARSRGAYPSRILQRAQSLLDLEQARLEQMNNGGRID